MGSSIRYQPYVDWLEGTARNVYTQFGEDGLIEAVLQRIGTTCCHCFEIGAADGRFFSNTLRLREDGWHAVLIEADDTQFTKLNRDFGMLATCIHEQATNLDETLKQTSISFTPDVGIIDIDGQDWHLWNRLELYRPRVMLVEIATAGEDEPVPVIGESGQAGLNAIKDLGRTKGYTLVATTYCNALFVVDEEL